MKAEDVIKQGGDDGDRLGRAMDGEVELIERDDGGPGLRFKNGATTLGFTPASARSLSEGP